MIKLIFCGDREWNDFDFILNVMSTLKERLGTFVVIEGNASGADILSRAAAKKLQLEWHTHPALWAKFGRAAGPIRNTEMLAEQPNGIVAFHRNITKSKGTKNMIEQGVRAGLPIWICKQQATGMFIPIHEGYDDISQFAEVVRRRVVTSNLEA